MKVLNLKILISKLFKRPKVLMVASLIAVVLCLIVSKFILSTHYLATGKILVSTNIIGEGNAKEELLFTDRILNTTAELLRSRNFIKGVVEELNLEDAFGGPAAVDRVASMLRVRPISGTNIIELSVRSKKAELATLIANTMCKVIITHSAKERFSFEKDVVSWISKKTANMKKKLQDSRARLLEFKESVGIVDLEKTHNTAIQQLAELEYSLSDARKSREELEPSYANMEKVLEPKKLLEEPLPMISDSNYKQLQSKYDYLKGMIEELLVKYQPSHPKVVELKEEFSRVKVSLDARARELLNNYKTIKAKEDELQKMVDQENKKILKLEEVVNEYKRLLDDLKEKEALFNTFLEKMEREFVGGLRTEQLSLAEQAYLPQKRQGPPGGLVILIGILIGMAATWLYNVLKDGERLFIEKMRVSPPEQKTAPPPAKGKGMYIERVAEKEEK